MNAQRFKTLLLREWMQHRLGWLLVMLAPLALALVLMPLQGPVVDSDNVAPPPVAVAAVAMLGSVAGVFALSWIVSMFQLPGLSRRDQQDRSVEFWLSLPATHVESIGATVLTHALLVPLAAMAVGLVCGPVMAAAAMLKIHGFAGLGQVPWGSLLGIALVGWMRLSIGLVLMTLWLAPLFMTLMAAAAWLKRWGVPVVIGGTVILANVLDRLYNNRLVTQLLKTQFEGAGKALFNASMTLEGRGVAQQLENESFVSLLQLMLHDLGAAFAQLASPHFVGGLVLAALCFYLLVLKRSQPA
jgi:ABC-2 type transport system permease protein